MTNEPTTLDPGARRKRRRRRILLLAPFALLAVGWQVTERFINIERYRGVIDKELELLIELPLDFGAMDLQLFPLPRLVVEEVTLGEGEFLVSSPRVSVTANLFTLLKRRLDLRTVSIQDPRIQLSESAEDFADHWRAYMLALETPDPPGGKPMLKVTLAEIVAPKLQVFRGETLYATGELSVHDVTGGAPRFTFNLLGDGIPNLPEAKGTFALAVKEDPIIEGTAQVTGMPLAEITGDHLLPDFLLDGTLDYRLTQDDRFTWDTEGTIRRSELTESMGTFTLDGEYQDGALALHHLEIDSVPLTVSGDLAFANGPAWTLTASEATLLDEGVTWLLAYLPDLPLKANASSTARCVLEQVRLGEDDLGVFSIPSCVVRTEGVDLMVDGATYALAGLRSHVAIADDTYDIRDISSDYLNVTGTVNVLEDDNIALTLTGQAYPGPTFPLPPSLTGVLRFEGGTADIHTFSTVIEGGHPVFAKSTLDVALRDGAIALWNRDRGDFVTLDGIGGTIELNEGRFHLDEFVAMGSEVSGALHPDAAFEVWTFSTSLRSDLTSPLWIPLYPDSRLTVTGGTIACSQVAGAYSRSQGGVDNLVVDGQIEGLGVDIEFPAYIDSLQADTIALSASDNRLTYGLAGRTRILGDLTATGTYAPTDGTVDTALTLTPRHAAKNLLPDEIWTAYGEIFFAPIDTMTIDIDYALKTGALRFASEAPLHLSGDMILGDNGTAGDLTLKAEAPATWLAPFLPDGVTATGDAQAIVRITPGTGAIQGVLDLADSRIAWRALAKPEDFAARVELTGEWGGDMLRVSTGHFSLGKTGTRFFVDERGLWSGDLDLDLADLAPLFPVGSALEGRLTGSFATALPQLDVQASGVLLSPPDEGPDLSLDGTIHLGDDGWVLDGVRIGQGGQHADLSLTKPSSDWNGAIESEAININQALSDYKALNTWWTQGEASGDKDAESPDDNATPWGPTGQIALSAKSLTWSNATVENVSTTATLAEESRVLSSIRVEHGEGHATGTATLLKGTSEAPDQLALDIVLAAMDLSVIEGLLSESSRDMRGAVDGYATLHLNMPADDTSILHGMDGQVAFTAQAGTLGKAGLASKFLAALRATDLLRMRIPSLRDHGVTFRELTGTLAIEGGVFTLSPYHMEDETYSLDAEAVLNFPADTATGLVELQILEGVTGVASRIPILGGAADMVNKAFSVELKISGTATDPEFRAGIPGALKTLESGARSIFRGTQRLVGQE